MKTRNHHYKILFLLSILFLISGLVPAFSQSRQQPTQPSRATQSTQGSVVATFGAGTQFLFTNDSVSNGATISVDLLFTGKSGFTVAFGTSINFEFDEFITPTLGLGYIYSNKFHIGGLINVIPHMESGSVFITPTFISGYDFGHFLLNGQFSYMIGLDNSLSGIRFILGAGVKIK